MGGVDGKPGGKTISMVEAAGAGPADPGSFGTPGESRSRGAMRCPPGGNIVREEEDFRSERNEDRRIPSAWRHVGTAGGRSAGTPKKFVVLESSGVLPCLGDILE